MMARSATATATATADARPRALAVRGRARLTRRGTLLVVVAGAAAVSAYALGFPQLLYVALMLDALPLGALVVLRVSRPRLAAVRAFSPHNFEARSAGTVSVTVSNRRALPTLRATWSDAVPWRSAPGGEGELGVLLPRGPRFTRTGNATTLRYEVRPPRRGIVAFGPLLVKTSDAFGFAISTVVVGEAQDVVVTPAVTTLAESSLSLSVGDGESRLVQRRSAGDDDDSMTREYRTGDAMRRVHWRASARHGDLMVRQEEQRSFPEARILIDTRRGGFRDVTQGEGGDRSAASSESFEWVVGMLASAAVHLRRHGFLVTVAESGTPQLDNGTGWQSGYEEEFLVDLAGLQLVWAPDDHAEPVGAGGRDRGRGNNGPLIALMGSPDEGTIQWMLRQRRPGDFAVAFLVSRPALADRVWGRRAPAAVDPVSMLTDSGWLVIPVASDDDPASVWQAVVFEAGGAHSRG